MNWNQEKISELRLKLASLIPAERDVRSLIEDAGLDPAYIDLSGTPVSRWYGVLTEAKKHQKLDSILARAIERYPSDEILLKISRVEYSSTIKNNEIDWRGAENVLVSTSLPIMSTEIQKEDLERIINLLGSIAVGGDAQNFYQNLIRSANLPEKWEVELLQRKQLSASDLIYWAKSKGENPKDQKYHTLGSILSVLLRETGDGEEIAIFMVRYQLCDPSSLPQELQSKINIQEIVNQKSPSSISNSGSAMSDRQRLRRGQERAGLEEEYSLWSEKLNRFRKAKAIETDTARKFQLEQQIKEAELELDRVNSKLESLAL
jgi:hypothetical protein